MKYNLPYLINLPPFFIKDIDVDDLSGVKKLSLILRGKILAFFIKILDKNIEVQATCVRVPVINGHSEAVFLRTIKETTREEVIELLNNSSGIKVIDNPESLKYPTPLENANDTEDVFVGRIRSQNINSENWTSMWIVADNVYGKGAALNTVQILEGLVENNKLC